MYYAVGVGSNLAGRGGDLVIIDDPHSEQTLMRYRQGNFVSLPTDDWGADDEGGTQLRAYYG